MTSEEKDEDEMLCDAMTDHPKAVIRIGLGLRTRTRNEIKDER